MTGLRHDLWQRTFFRERRADGEARGTVLHVHGLGESGLSLEGIAAHPALGGWRHLVPDLPGYGRSPWPDEPGGLAELADHLAAFVEAQDAGPVVALGHSMGGVLVLLLAERHPALVRAIVDVEGNKAPGDCQFSGQAAGHPEGEFARTEFARLVAGVWEAGLEDPALRGYYASLRFADPRSFWRHARDLVELSQTRALARRLAATGRPAFYVAGAPDGASAESLALVDAAGIAGLVLEPAGHWPFLDHPEPFCRALAAFLDRV
ncbi:MAG: alpha/beta fold hydrolase [Acidobacteria bacterium]|nr:MAG: alpha/beta fold hydrolase [Acidobacteriota bacterium]